jgi:hypothetical protein
MIVVVIVIIVVLIVVVVVVVVLIVVVIVVSQYLQRFTCISVATGLTSFTVQSVEDAIRCSKSSTAVGPDGLTAIHLKHLGPRALSYLTELFNISTRKAEIPAIWKKAIIIPILKPGKSAELGSS